MTEGLRSLAAKLAGATFMQYARAVLKIEDNMGKLIPFELNDAQRIVYREIKRQEDAGRPVRILILKGRRQGMSTLIQTRIAWRMLTGTGIRSHTVAHNLALTHELYGKFNRALVSLPEMLQPDMAPGGTRGRLAIFADTPDPEGGPPLPGSVYRGDSAADPEQVGRGTGVHIAHYTEVPQWSHPGETMQALLSTVPDKPGTEMYVETTAKGASGWFYETWVAAQRDIARGIEPEFVPVFVPWFETREYRRKRRSGEPGLDKREQIFKEKYSLDNEQCYWYRDQIRRYGDRVVEEFPSRWEEAFLASGMPFFQREHIEFFRERVKERTPIRVGRYRPYPGGGRFAFQKDDFGPTHVFEQPVEGHRYSVGVDFASGRAADSSAIVVIDIDSRRVVATHQSKMLPDDVLVESILLARTFNQAIIVPERSGIGQMAVDRLVNEYAYPNVYRDTDGVAVRSKRGTRFGFATSVATRKWLLEEMAHHVHSRMVDIPCARLVDEMQSFVYTDEEGDHAAAAEGSHDDLVMAFAIAIRGYSSAPARQPSKKSPSRRSVISSRTGY